MSEVGTRRRGPGWVRLGHGLHVPTAAQGLAERLRAWSQVLPDSAVFTHLTAAELRGWWLPAPASRPVRAAVGEDERHPQRRGLAVTRLAAPPAIELVRGLRVATAAETLLATACDLGVLDLVALGDSALRCGDCTLEELQAAAGVRRRGLHGCVRSSRCSTPAASRRGSRSCGCCTAPRTSRWSRSASSTTLRGASSRAPTSGWWARVGSPSTTARCIGTSRPTAATSTGTGDWPRRAGRGTPTAAELLHGGGGLIASVDALLGRGWDPARLQRWRALVHDSSYSSGKR